MPVRENRCWQGRICPWVRMWNRKLVIEREWGWETKQGDDVEKRREKREDTVLSRQ